MVSYETIPADPAAEDGLLAKPKPKVSLKRVIGAAAITSFILGALAATALSMPAGVPKTMLKGDPNCNDDNAHADSSDLSNKLNKALNGDKGFIFRYRFDGQVPCKETHFQVDGEGNPSCGFTQCNDDKQCGVAATVLSNKIHTENPVYCIQNPHGCDSASVGYALLDHWSGHSSKGDMGGWAYFPTDANSVDGRDWRKGGGFPGQGCHYDDDAKTFNQQYLGEWGNGMITYDQTSEGSPYGAPQNCMCDYENFDPKDVGDLLVEHIASSDKNADYGDKWKPLDGKLQPMYYGQDLSSCWIPENGPWQKIFDIQNSLYDKRRKWWNSAIGGHTVPDENWEKGKDWYPGWNEVAFDYNIDLQKNVDKLEALVVVMPDGFDNLCNFEKDMAQEIDDVLNQYWTDGYGHLPVVILKNTKEGGKFQKETFVQSFTFENGNCIYDNGDGHHYYKGDGC